MVTVAAAVVAAVAVTMSASTSGSEGDECQSVVEFISRWQKKTFSGVDVFMYKRKRQLIQFAHLLNQSVIFIL